MKNSLISVDHTALKANQLTIIVLNLSAFILNIPWIAALVAVVMLGGTMVGKPGFLPVYNWILIPSGWAKPKVIQDNPEPHRFAQGLGGIFMIIASILLWAGIPFLGWVLVWLVTGLAALNAFGGFCVGCFIYYWFARINAPGFAKQPPEGTFPGMQPKGAERNGS